MFDFRGKFVRSWIAFVLASCMSVILTGCGSGGSSTSPTLSPKVQVKMGDAPADSVLSFELHITSISLTQQGGGTVSVLNTPEDIELAHLAGTVEMLTLANVGPGTYTGASVTATRAEITYLPNGSTTPVEKQFTFSSPVTFSFTPAITIGAGATVLNFDLNLAQSLTMDASGNVIAINPVFTASASAVKSENAQDDESGKLDDVVGVVSGITAANGSTLASFAVTPKNGGQALIFSVDSTTQYGDGLSQFSSLQNMMLVQVDGVTQPDGSFLAKEVELMEASDGVEADGIVTKTTGSPVTSVSVLVQDDAGANISQTIVGTSIAVDVTTAVFKNPINEGDFSVLLQSLPFTAKFDNTSIAAGQRIEVDSSTSSPVQSTIVASKVSLREQALTGTVASAASGSKASFSLLLDADSAFVKLTGVSSVNIYQVSSTELSGITSVTPGTKVRVRGLLLYDGANYQFVAAKISLP